MRRNILVAFLGQRIGGEMVAMIRNADAGLGGFPRLERALRGGPRHRAC
jgi:hypothetical protein